MQQESYSKSLKLHSPAVSLEQAHPLPFTELTYRQLPKESFSAHTCTGTSTLEQMMLCAGGPCTGPLRSLHCYGGFLAPTWGLLFLEMTFCHFNQSQHGHMLHAVHRAGTSTCAASSTWASPGHRLRAVLTPDQPCMLDLAHRVSLWAWSSLHTSSRSLIQPAGLNEFDSPELGYLLLSTKRYPHHKSY